MFGMNANALPGMMQRMQRRAPGSLGAGSDYGMPNQMGMLNRPNFNPSPMGGGPGLSGMLGNMRGGMMGGMNSNTAPPATPQNFGGSNIGAPIDAPPRLASPSPSMRLPMPAPPVNTAPNVGALPAFNAHPPPDLGNDIGPIQPVNNPPPSPMAGPSPDILNQILQKRQMLNRGYGDNGNQ
ncbi:MAG TPA: hypothetical protein VNX68_04730 [Nitrosopumilaceae archaeon]|jgi:hypothetical protein|nr:hypothetical protein [Nitrosopumilaceae archaeon]